MSRRKVARVVWEEPPVKWWFRREVDPIPRSGRGARYHHIGTIDENDPNGLIECADGAVFSTEDVK